jgi:xanthine dehydrogenase molybdopterin-binding subunit B
LFTGTALFLLKQEVALRSIIQERKRSTFWSSTQAPHVHKSLIAIVLLIIGATQGMRRVQIAILASQVIAGQGGKGEQEKATRSLQRIENKMLQMVIPENIVALVIIALMVYAANPF